MAPGDASIASDAAPPQHAPIRRRPAAWLVVILLVAGGLRLIGLRTAPPGLNQDEAANAWNAWCLFRTGRDQTGAAWPIVYSRCLGENRSTLFLYVMLPFQAIGGLNIETTRLPGAVAGVAAVLLMYVVGSRLFGRPTGLVAAAMMAIEPWHVQQSRWGHESTLCPLLVLAPLAAMLWADLPLDDDPHRRPRPWPAAIAGFVLGVACYGYPAVRLFLPLFLFLVVATAWRTWKARLTNFRSRGAILAFAAGAAIALAPLAWAHVAEPQAVAKRHAMMRLWGKSDSLGTRVGKVVSRYAAHYGMDFLFLRGDHYEAQSPPEGGMFRWHMLPLMLLGAAACLRGAPGSRAARLLLVWLVAYPAGDCLARHMSMHALRSAPGLTGLILLAAVGVTAGWGWLSNRNRTASWAFAACAALAAAGLNGHCLHRYFGEYARDPKTYHQFQTDLVQACEWLRPRFDDTDIVFCTISELNMPYIVTLVALGYEPEQWFRDKKLDLPLDGWDTVIQYGKMRFAYLPEEVDRTVESLKQDGLPQRVVFILRPGQLNLKQEPIHEIRRPDGATTLLIYGFTL